MSELSEMTTFWAGVKGFVASAVGSVFREEEAVAVGPGSVTVRPYGEDGTQELRALAGAVIRPGDRVVVLRLPALKLVLGTPTVRGVASVIPLPFGGYWGRFGIADEVARVDHTHSTEDRVPVAQVWSTYTPFSTPNNATYADIGTQVVTLGPGIWSFSLLALATMWRSVASGEVFLEMEVANDGYRLQSMVFSRNTPVAVANEKDIIRLPHKVHAQIYLPTGGDVTITIRGRGGVTTGTTYAKQVALSGEIWRVG